MGHGRGGEPRAFTAKPRVDKPKTPTASTWRPTGSNKSTTKHNVAGHQRDRGRRTNLSVRGIRICGPLAVQHMGNRGKFRNFSGSSDGLQSVGHAPSGLRLGCGSWAYVEKATGLWKKKKNFRCFNNNLRVEDSSSSESEPGLEPDGSRT